jgi:hypothetical protein
VCLPDQRRVSLVYFPIDFDSNASLSSLPPLGLYIYNLILGLLLVDVAINIHESSECNVPSSFKDFVDMATTASGTEADAFTAFLAVLCLTAIMSLAEEYESLSFCTEEDKGNCPLSNQFSIPTVVALVMPPVAVALTYVYGWDLTGALHFNGAFMIPILYGLLPILLYRSVRQYQLQDLAISPISSYLQVFWMQEHLCALRKEIVQDISWLQNLTR